MKRQVRGCFYSVWATIPRSLLNSEGLKVFTRQLLFAGNCKSFSLKKQRHRNCFIKTYVLNDRRMFTFFFSRLHQEKICSTDFLIFAIGSIEIFVIVHCTSFDKNVMVNSSDQKHPAVNILPISFHKIYYKIDKYCFHRFN